MLEFMEVSLPLKIIAKSSPISAENAGTTISHNMQRKTLSFTTFVNITPKPMLIAIAENMNMYEKTGLFG